MDEAQVTVATRGDVGARAVRYAQQKVGRVTRRLDRPLRFARVKLTAVGDPARERPAVAQAVLDIDGQMVRAQVAAHDMQEAVDLLEERLQVQLEMRKDHRLAHRKRGAVARESGEWRHGDPPAHRPPFFPRPVGEREVVRHKTYELRGLTPAQAHEELVRLDYDFHLFTDALTGEDSVVYRLADGGAELQSLSSPRPAPVLEEAEAVERLDLTGEPFLLYRDPTTQRGAVAYRRYDGHYGLITAEAAASPRAGTGSAGGVIRAG